MHHWHSGVYPDLKRRPTTFCPSCYNAGLPAPLCAGGRAPPTNTAGVYPGRLLADYHINSADCIRYTAVYRSDLYATSPASVRVRSHPEPTYQAKRGAIGPGGSIEVSSNQAERVSQVGTHET